MPLSSIGYHSCFVFGRGVPGLNINPKAALITEDIHGFFYLFQGNAVTGPTKSTTASFHIPEIL
jgi:hypothetical protein